jgi:hypothetical protein
VISINAHTHWSSACNTTFLRIKKPPTRPNQTTEITHIYDRGEAYDVIRRSQEDYHKHFGDLKQSLLAPLRDS